MLCKNKFAIEKRAFREFLGNNKLVVVKTYVTETISMM